MSDTSEFAPLSAAEQLRQDQLADFFRRASTAQFIRAYVQGAFSLIDDFDVFKLNASEKLVACALQRIPELTLDMLLVSLLQQHSLDHDPHRRVARARTLCRYVADRCSVISLAGNAQILYSVVSMRLRGQETILSMYLAALRAAFARLPPEAILLPRNVIVWRPDRSPWEALRNEYFRIVFNEDFSRIPLHNLLVELLDDLCAQPVRPSSEENTNERPNMLEE